MVWECIQCSFTNEDTASNCGVCNLKQELSGHTSSNRPSSHHTNDQVRVEPRPRMQQGEFTKVHLQVEPNKMYKIPGRNEGISKCEHHQNKDVKFFCKDCRNSQLACTDCVRTVHNKHNLVLLNRITDEDLQNLTKT